MSWLRDPLIAFFLGGMAIFAAVEWLSAGNGDEQIVITPGDMARLKGQWQLQMRREPTEVELANLVDQFVREEIYYREALKLGLDQGDTIVRRRMVQKLTFLTEDTATAGDVAPQVLQDFYASHIDDYGLPVRYSFSHRYFSSDKRTDAKHDATTALADSDNTGDPFMLPIQYAQRSAREIGDLFGRDFATALEQLDAAEDWQGPIQSVFGWHAIRLNAVHPSETLPFNRVADRVAADWQQAARSAANDAYFDTLRSSYDIVVAEESDP